jgi:pimeloyl-ACP methyl ester carboxylesterase
MNYLKWIGLFLILGILGYFSGPSAHVPLINANPLSLNHSAPSLNQLEMEINEKEKKVVALKEDNNARIVWADSSTKQKTPYVFVYLHGFSASQAEGFPVHRNIARRYGCNLYLSRLYAHGLNEKEPLLNFTSEKLIESAKEAIAIGKQLGEKVILISTSTGGTLSLILAAEDRDIACLIMYSPNVDLFDNKSFLLIQPWGLQIARMVMGSDYYTFKASPEAQQYWTTKYRIEALLELKSLINVSMNEKTFKAVHQPVFIGYYYKDETHQDNVVSIPRMIEMSEQLGTPSNLKRIVNFPEARYHVIGSSYWNPNTKPIEDSTDKFLEEVMLLKPVKKQ